MSDQDKKKILQFPSSCENYLNIFTSPEQTRRQKPDEDQPPAENIKLQDKTTGLLSRDFVEQELSRLNTERQMPISIIKITIKNLEMITQINGIDKRKETILDLSHLLEDTLRQEDILGRWAQAKFLILLPQTSCHESLKIFYRLQNHCRQKKQEISPAPRVDITLAINEKTKDEINELVANPEKNMITAFDWGN